MMAFAWLIEFALESAGAIIYLRRSKLLSGILAFCAITDYSAAAFRPLYSASFIYGWCAWIQLAAKSLLLIWLGCSICGMFVKERDKVKTVLATGFISAASMPLVVSAFFSRDSLKDRLLDAEIVASILLLGMIALGWIGRSSYLSAEWKIITAGFVLMVGSDLLFTALWTFWDGVRHWYPLGTIAALGVWVAGPILPYRLKDCRADLAKVYLQVEDVREAVRM